MYSPQPTTVLQLQGDLPLDPTGISGVVEDECRSPKYFCGMPFPKRYQDKGK